MNALFDSGHGVQIVKIGNERSYELDEETLKQVLSDDIGDCGVVVISVAGAFRGGKSFLLNFFLRYLNYTFESQEARSDEEWLGNPHTPLEGFSWRGGSERDTTGVVMWSKPIKVILPSGEQVVVLLLDTQGTFDSSSTVRDCSTIFALSTLLSSVQIYNVSQNIKEDDLQHLQLFAEYGIMAAGPNDEPTPFQKLKFIIRDWSYPYEHSYGESGGQELLQKRLEIHSDQPVELQELRKRLGSCFDDISCFLMPHPGFTVAEPQFDGQLANIREEFKKSLLELVPSLLHPQELRTKQINGQPVTVRAFVEYLKAYIRVFNSDQLPTPVSIAKATIETGVLLSCEAARREYRTRMTAAAAPPRSRPALRHAHVAARACSLLAARATLPPALAAQPLEELRQELNELLPYYEILNENNNNEIAAEALEVYLKDVLPSEVTREALCASPEALDAAHARATAAATSTFSARRVTEPDEEDDELLHFTEEVDNTYKDLTATNDKNNEIAILDSLKVYSEYIERECGVSPCLPSSTMVTNHKKAKEKAVQHFQSKRNYPSQTQEQDNHLTKLQEKLGEVRARFERTNRINNETVIKDAKLLYKIRMEANCPPNLCLHPKTLEDDHERVYQEALTFFRSKRSIHLDQNETIDDYIITFKSGINTIYRSLKDKNIEMNVYAVESSHEIYKKKMKNTMPYFQSSMSEMISFHEQALNDAYLYFAGQRHRSSSRLGSDIYKSALRDEINASKHIFEYENAQKPVFADVVGRVVGIAATATGIAGALGFRFLDNNIKYI